MSKYAFVIETEPRLQDVRMLQPHFRARPSAPITARRSDHHAHGEYRRRTRTRHIQTRCHREAGPRAEVAAQAEATRAGDNLNPRPSRLPSFKRVSLPSQQACYDIRTETLRSFTR